MVKCRTILFLTLLAVMTVTSTPVLANPIMPAYVDFQGIITNRLRIETGDREIGIGSCVPIAGITIAGVAEPERASSPTPPAAAEVSCSQVLPWQQPPSAAGHEFTCIVYSDSAHATYDQTPVKAPLNLDTVCSRRANVQLPGEADAKDH